MDDLVVAVSGGNEAIGRRVRGGVAIVGMACLFPGAPDLTKYWENILRKVDAISDPPAEAWDASVHFDIGSAENDRVYCKRGGYLASVATFNPLENGVMPRSVDGGEPDQWLALKVARAALADAGYLDRLDVRQRTGVIIGKGTYINRGNLSMVQHGVMVDQTLDVIRSLHPEFGEGELSRIRQELKRGLPPFNSETASGLIPNIIAGRIANKLDLMGPTYTVDAACASSLIACQIGMRELLAGECDLVLVGGAQITTPVPILSLFCQLNALSHRQEIRPFDKDADGTVLGEGIGMIALKRREDAERDGDRVYAILKGVGVASDGRGASVMAPRIEGEELALLRAYDRAGVEPATVELIEAHGTATPVGDAAEVQALGRVLGGRQRVIPHRALGSVKSMIGHTMPASGMAGLIKAALALYHRVLPPTINVSEPHPSLQLGSSAFYVNTETRPWVHGERDAPRRAGVNAFGFGGINAHAVLEEQSSADETAFPGHQPTWDSEVFVLRGKTREALVANVDRLLAVAESAPEAPLKDLAYTINGEGEPGGSGLGLVATDVADLQAKLRKARERLTDARCRQIKDVNGIYYFSEPLAAQGKIAVLFPGEGAQYPNMLADLCVHFPRVRQAFDQMDRIFADHPRRYVASDFIFPPPLLAPTDREIMEKRLWQSDGAWEAVLAGNQALWTLISDLGITPDVLVGHSTGEYSAMRAAGVVDWSDDADFRRFVRHLNDGYLNAVRGDELPRAALLAVGADRETVQGIASQVSGPIFVAMDNCVHQTVLVGESAAAEQALEIVKREGLIYEFLSFDRAYHTPLFTPYLEHLRRAFAETRVRRPDRAIYSCTTAEPYPEDPNEVRALMAEHWVAPVEFRRTIERLYADGVRVFVESGPRGNLTTFVEDILRGRPHCAVPANVQRRSGVRQLNHLVAILAAHGVPVRFEPLYRRRRPRRMVLDHPAEFDRRASGELKLATGFPVLRLSPAFAAELRALEAGPTTRSEGAAAVAASGAASGTQGPRMATEVVEPREIAAPVLGPGEHPSVALQRDEALVGFEEGANLPAGDETTGEDDVAPVRDVEVLDVPLPAANGDGRLVTDAMHSYLETMNQFLTVQERVMRAYLGDASSSGGWSPAQTLAHDLDEVPGRHAPADRPGEPAAGAEVAARRLPLLGEIVRMTPGEELVARRTFDPAEDLYLRDHTLGRNVSDADPQLTALAVMPLTMSLEILAEGAAALDQQRHVVAIRDVRAHRWIDFAGGPQVLEVTARRLAEEESAFAVQIHNLSDLSDREPLEGVSRSPVVEGTVLLADAHPVPPLSEPLRLTNQRPSMWTGERRYAEGMFHGPAWQGVASVERTGDDGAIAMLPVLPFDGFFRGQGPPRFVLDPVVLDAAGQVVGFWALEHLATARMVFPFRLDRLDVYGPQRPVGENLTCQAAIRLLSDLRTLAQIDVIDPTGRLWMRLTGWEDMRFASPPGFRELVLAPRETDVSASWAEALSDLPTAESRDCRRLSTAFPFNRAFWKLTWAGCVLSRREREQFRQLHAPEGRQLLWLAGRTAAKEAVRALLRTHFGRIIPHADVEVWTDERGCPRVDGSWRSFAPGALVVSIAHTDDVAVAVAALRDADRHDASGPPLLGIDVEKVRPQPRAFAEVAFTPAEELVLGRLTDEGRPEWLLRLWCAKEAVGKALGCGLVEGPTSVRIADVDEARGIVRLELAGQLARWFPEFGRSRIIAYTNRHDDLVVATTLCEAETPL